METRETNNSKFHQWNASQSFSAHQEETQPQTGLNWSGLVPVRSLVISWIFTSISNQGWVSDTL